MWVTSPHPDTPFRPDDAPFWAAYYADRARLVKSFAIPGHKCDPSLVGDLVLPDRPVSLSPRLDIPSFTLMREAERRAAEVWGADVCRFSVNGSSAANQAALSAIAGPGDKVVAARALHKSLFFGFVYSGTTPIWLTADAGRAGFSSPISPATVQRALVKNPTAKAVVLGSPSYMGSVSDVGAIADVCHEQGVPLVVDSAWGGHFGFHPSLPQGAIKAGADIAVISTHKTLPSAGQAAMLLARNGLIDLNRLNRCFDGTQTTSPSAATIASIDGARAYMQAVGSERLGSLITAIQRARQDINRIPGLRALQGATVDPMKLVITFPGAAVDGRLIEKYLNRRGLEVEMADACTLIPQITVADTPTDVAALTSHIADCMSSLSSAIAVQVEQKEPSGSLWSIDPEVCMTPRDAFFARLESVPRHLSVGRVAGELAAPYPPGIPVVAPGERITPHVIEAIEEALMRGLTIAYAADPTLNTILVVDA